MYTHLKGKVSSDFGLLSKPKFNLGYLYLNIKQCILILMKKYTIWSHNLVLLLLKKRTLFSKIPTLSVHESKGVNCCTQLSLQTLAVELSCQAQLFLRFWIQTNFYWEALRVRARLSTSVLYWSILEKKYWVLDWVFITKFRKTN